MCIVFEGYGVPIFQYFIRSIIFLKLISYVYAAEYPVNGAPSKNLASSIFQSIHNKIENAHNCAKRAGAGRIHAWIGPA